jgi:hypothetical protein
VRHALFAGRHALAELLKHVIADEQHGSTRTIIRADRASREKTCA